MDLLQGRLPPLRVAGIYVGSAHRIKDDSGEAFCIRLYRGTDSSSSSRGGRVVGDSSSSSFSSSSSHKPNKFGFVHAFTDEPTAFAGTFKVEHVMKALHVRRVFLWPRFEARVQNSLQPVEDHAIDLDEDDEGAKEDRDRMDTSLPRMPEVVEISIPVTRSMEIIQGALESAMDACLKELGHHKFLGLDFDLTVSNNLFKDFGRSIQKQLDKRWHLVSRKTKQITRDLSTLRRLAFCVLRYDGPTFLQYLEMLRVTEGVNSVWLFLDAAHIIFDEAKKRVYKLVIGSEKKPGNNGKDQVSRPKQKIVPVLEQPAKWAHLKQILEEVQQDRTKMLQSNQKEDKDKDEEDDRSQEQMYNILILTQEKLLCTQLQHLLVMGGDAIMKDAFNQYLQWRSISSKESTKKSNQRKSENNLRMTGAAGSSMRHEDQALQAVAPPSSKRKRARTKVEDEDGMDVGTPWLVEGVHFYALEGKELELELYRIKPAFVILYDQSPSAIRQLEVYSASTLLKMKDSGDDEEQQCQRLLRIYMLFYADSLEQQKFCAAVDRERRVFKSLIEQKATMFVPIAEDGTAVVEKHNPSDPTLSAAPLIPFGAGSSANNAITRQAGGLVSQAARRVGTIIVDMREFSSNLPGVLHSHGFKIIPCTLEVGDYILSPEVCVERKAIPDLIASFGSGRLFHQALAMSKHYKYPVLLIEFSGDKAFALQGAEDWSSNNDISQRALGSKLTLLSIHVPKLRIIWSRSPQATAEIFTQLKSNQEEPKLDVAQGIGLPEDPHMRTSATCNQPAIDLLRKLPGVVNWRGLANRSLSLSRLASMSEKELEEAMHSSKGAKALYKMLNAPCVGVPNM